MEGLVTPPSCITRRGFLVLTICSGYATIKGWRGGKIYWGLKVSTKFLTWYKTSGGYGWFYA